MRFKVKTDNYGFYEVFVWRWYLPFWIKSKTFHFTEADALRWIELTKGNHYDPLRFGSK